MKKHMLSLPAAGRLLAFLLAVILTLGTALTAVPAQAEETASETTAETAETIWITGRYISPGDKVNLRSWSFPYSDSYFLGDDSVYLHSLAKASLGMALSAFRNTKQPLGRQQENIIYYLEHAGFTCISVEGYDSTPAADTISSVIAMKKIGDFTLIATAVCGGGYGNEWKSNFLVGDETRSMGFHNASKQVQARIRAYLEQNGIEGEARLWIAGYSRAAAVSNITAADMTDSGLFTQVYAYTFATPNTTRDKGNYTNIFNIIGKTDPVPCVPLRDWGYQHYGIDLYTPAQEFDSDYTEKAAKADAVAQNLTGKSFRNNPIINYTLRNILDFLLAAYPTSASYQPTLGQVLIDIWGGEADQMVTILEKALQDSNAMPEEQAEEFVNLADYVEKVLSYQLRKREEMVQNGLWDEETGLADNVAHEHNPDVYVEWVFSTDDPAELYSTDADSYYRFVLYGDVTVDVYDAYGFVQRVKPDGTVITDPAAVGEEKRSVSTCPLLFTTVESSTLTMVIPKDTNYALSVTTEYTQELRYLASTYKLGSLKGDIGSVHQVTLSPEDEYYIIASEEFFSWDEENTDVITNISTIGKYSPSLMVQIESMNVFNLTLSDLVLVVMIVLIVLALLIFAEIVLLIVRLIRHKRRKAWVTIVTDGVLTVFFFTLAELSRYHLNAITTVYIILKSIASFWVLILSLQAALNAKRRLPWFIFAAMIAALCGDISSNAYTSLMLFCLFMVIMIVGILLEKRTNAACLIVAGTVWAALLIVLFIYRNNIGSLMGYFIFYTALLALLPCLSFRVHPLLFVGCLCFAIASAILGVNMVFIHGFVFRAVGVGYYLLSTFIMAMSPYFLYSGKHSMDRTKVLPAEE